MLQKIAIMFLLAGLSSAQDTMFVRGAREIGLSGTAYVTHDSPQDAFGVVTGRAGYYVAGNQQLGVDTTLFAYSRAQDLYLSGFYRYFFAGSERRWAPFAGAGLGANVAHFNQFGTVNTLIVKPEAGIRLLFAPRFAFDVAYAYLYRRNANYGFTGTNSSIVTIGFAKSW